MDSIKLGVAGRGKLVIVGLDVNADGVSIRLEDERNHEFWASIGITTDQLRQLLDATQKQADAEDMIAATIVDDLGDVAV